MGGIEESCYMEDRRKGRDVEGWDGEWGIGGEDTAGENGG